MKTRLHLLVLIQAEDAQTQVEAAERLTVQPNMVWHWVQTYHDGGLKSLLTLDRRSAPAAQYALPTFVFDALKHRLADPEASAATWR